MASKYPWLDVMDGWINAHVTETPGADVNPLISQMWADAGKEGWTEREPWCGACVAAALKKARREILPNGLGALARNWLKYGTPSVGADGSPLPVVGAVAIWPRGKPPSGHVNFVREVYPDGSIDCDGGNQAHESGGAVTRTHYSAKTVKTALGFRIPPEPASLTQKVIRSLPVASPSTRVNAAWGGVVWLVLTIMGWLKDLFETIAGWVDMLPDMTGEASSLIASNQQIMEWVGIPWGKVGISMALACFAYVIIRTAMKPQTSTTQPTT
jgi:hypothetical protein